MKGTVAINTRTVPSSMMSGLIQPMIVSCCSTGDVTFVKGNTCMNEFPPKALVNIGLPSMPAENIF